MAALEGRFPLAARHQTNANSTYFPALALQLRKSKPQKRLLYRVQNYTAIELQPEGIAARTAVKSRSPHLLDIPGQVRLLGLILPVAFLQYQNQCGAAMERNLNLDELETIPHLSSTSMAGASKERVEALNAIAEQSDIPRARN